MPKQSTKDLIINTASELFYSKGYNLIGINEIIEKSGIAKATLYNHFKSKEDLCLAYLHKRDTELLENISEFCQSKSKGNKQLLAVLEFLLRFFEADNFNGCWCLRTMAEVPKDNIKIRAKIKANKSMFLNFIQNLVEENKASLTKLQKEKLSKKIYLLYEGSVAESHLQEDAWPILLNIEVLKTILNKF